MKKQNKFHLSVILLLSLFTLSIVLYKSNLINRDFNINKELQNDDNNIEFSQDQTLGGYNLDKLAYFDILEEAQSRFNIRDFQVRPDNYFNISTPSNWTTEYKRFLFETYHKNQTIDDGEFSVGGVNSPWDKIKLDLFGGGTISQSFEPNPLNPKNVLTHIEHSSSALIQPGFNAWKEFAFWNQTMGNLNPSNLEIQAGELYQKKDETQLRNDFIEEANLKKDIESPYGGKYESNDVINMDHEDEFMYVYINPATGIFGGNPSAAWWSYLEIPYRVDYAEVSISWAIDPSSSFEESDDYQVSARINNRYIDGRTWIQKDDNIPLNGSKNALMVYNDSNYLEHGYITRTYDITKLINRTIGINKFDFGVWAKNPTGEGDTDMILTKFDFIEIKYNVSDKYETAQLNFDYLCVDNLNGEYEVPTDDPNKIINPASLYLFLDNGTNQERFKILPFNSFNITDSKSDPFNRINFRLSQKHIKFLKASNLKFYLGILFEKDIYNDVDYDLFFDNISLYINYKHPNPQYSEIQYQVDQSSNWKDIINDITYINTSSWIAGQNHSINFRTLNSSFGEKLFVNFKSIHKFNISKKHSEGAYANYEIPTENDDVGNWEIIYDNSFSYSLLQLLNTTQFFNLSKYDINYLKLPAFDEEGSKSENWEIHNVISPTASEFKNNLLRYNYSENYFFQNARISNAFLAGNWTLQAFQKNYITNGQFNNTEFYQETPLILRNSTFHYNFSLLYDEFQNYSGSYALTILNSSGYIMETYPKRITTLNDTSYLTGEITIPPSYKPNLYYFSIRWNDTNSFTGNTFRLGSRVKSFFIINATTAGFNKDNLSVLPGEIANFSLFYRVKYTNFGINTTNIFVLENSTGSFIRWGRAWSGSNQYSFEYIGNGNYTIHLDTTGAPNNNYTIKFILFKQYNQPQNLTSSLRVASNNLIYVEVTYGAYEIKTDHYHIDNKNIPYVNDTINSIIQLNLTDSSGDPIADARIIGKIGEFGVFSQAKYIYEVIPIAENLGLYNLTVDTTGLNATNDNKTFFISCSAIGFKLKEITVNLTIKPIPTQIHLQKIESVYEEGKISIQASMYNLIDPNNPKPNNHGTLTYHILPNSPLNPSGTLDLILSGVYIKNISISGLSAGNYSIYLNGTAFNCMESMSNIRNFTVLSQESTKIDINIPNFIRILKPFDIRANLIYLNGSVISNELITLNITRINKDGTDQDSLIISDETDVNGYMIYNDYIIPEDFKDGIFIVNATFNGDGKLKASKARNESIISGKIPIYISIINHPNNTARVGYSATYRIRINISAGGEILKNRIILFNAYYENNVENPFVSAQLYTDSNGETEYTIQQVANGYDNMTVYFEYLGSSTIAYNNTSRLDEILPKWSTNLSYNPLPSIIRHGQTIYLNLTFSCPENNSISFSGLTVSFKIEYGSITEFYNNFISENNTLLFSYSIADSFDSNLNITITMNGNNRITELVNKTSIEILEKLPVNIIFIDKPNLQYLQGSQFISVLIKDSQENYLIDVDIIFELYNGESLVDRKTVKTNEEGIASTSLDFFQTGNNFIIKVSFAEAGIYQSSELSSSQIRVVNEFILFLDYLPYILIAIGTLAGISLIIYRGVIIPRRRRKYESLKKIYQRLSDVENIQYILILTKDGGVPIFSKSLADVPIDESLVSGFLSAISSFGEEIGYKMKKQKGALEELSYRQFKIILDEGDYVKTALLLLKRPSESLKRKLSQFTQTFEENFKLKLVQYNGKALPEAKIMKYVEDVFEADLLYPHQVVEKKVKSYINNTSRKDLSRKILITAKQDDFESSFYLRDMINHLKTSGIEELKSFGALEKLKKNNIVFAINPRTNYIIEQLQPVIKSLNRDDQEVLFAALEGIVTVQGLQKHLSKKDYSLTTDITDILKKLFNLNLIDSEGKLTETGSAIATLLQLIPDL